MDDEKEINSSRLMSKSEILPFIRCGFTDLNEILQQKDPLPHNQLKISNELNDSRRENHLTLAILGL